MAFEIDIGFTSLSGKKTINEDFCAAMLPEAGREGFGAICAIADGVSTGGKGKEAAQTTVMSLVQDYFGTRETWDTTVALDRVISAHNTWLTGVNRRRAASDECGLTTLTALVMRGHTYTLAHVGDTRAYLLRAGEIEQLTTDHSNPHPDFKHQLLRVVGADERLVVDYSQGDLQVGDVFILLTDGVHGSLSDRRIRKMVEQGNAQEISNTLTEVALNMGSPDNASAIVVRVLGLQESHLRDEELAARHLPIPHKLKIGDFIDGLVVTSLVADSGVNLIYQVREPVSQKLYALKTLHPSREKDQEERAMLAHEAWLAKRMQTSSASDHLVRLHSLMMLPSGKLSSSFYLLYDWHAGQTLQQALQERGAFSVPQAVQAAMAALKALGAMHRQGVIHRDIKPSNLHLGEGGVLRVLDLGVALSGHEPESLRSLHAGTPSYINPEQFGYALHGEAQAHAADAASDLYALGVTLYQLLTGKLPYGEVLPYQTGRYYRDPTPPSRIQPEVPVWLDHIVLKAVSRDQKQRFETAEEFLLALERGASRPIHAPLSTPLLQRNPVSLWKIAFAVSVLFNFLLIVWLLFLPKA
ncbi:bifunctional protein-serine/threonine kinase/phosphatase [Variovorax sp. PCZ-1]|uniref:bifunctional protein-serine/threonine kinase/phosphatase n=1 Tax=Variovorax sp. PCZ-1 TaxID=2835533 RepID=UPI001BCC4546|nr:bifunctional protein-serine/threonine kinase/phosphatase [Variovorax sp. PCZ-1]MBS7806820.1 bifunctional protein-serine/threonine kinase/phosphatase [Variovorax sp. PCZ-1]